MHKDNNFPEIRSDQFPYNMGAWLTEKAEHGLTALIDVRKILKEQNGNIEKDNFEYINDSLSYAMWNLTKIYSFSLGSKWETTDSDLLFDKLNDGFEELKVKYGLLEKTSKQNATEIYNLFISNIFEYLELNQAPGRSYLQELFENNAKYIDEKTLGGSILRGIEKELYKVANGEKSWADFILFAKERMDFFKVQKGGSKCQEI